MKQREFLLKSTCLASLLVGAPVQMFPPLSANAQKVRPSDDGWKEEKVTLRVSNETLGSVLTKVAKSVNADLIFQGVTLVGINDLTTLNVKDKPLDKVLGELIGNQMFASTTKVDTVPSSYLLTNDKKTMRRVLLLVVLSLEVTTTNHWWVLPYQSPMEPSRRALLDVLPMRMVSSVCASTVSHPSVFLISVTRPSLSRFFVQIVI